MEEENEWRHVAGIATEKEVMGEHACTREGVQLGQEGAVLLARTDGEEEART